MRAVARVWVCVALHSLPLSTGSQNTRGLGAHVCPFPIRSCDMTLPLVIVHMYTIVVHVYVRTYQYFGTMVHTYSVHVYVYVPYVYVRTL